ncbi:MAG TPA: SelB C-terminal domain-containing protein [Streptosporangiaceae bacterium]|nr:SelB C-terminal domain-containing protein [Streptosporangiaceae bacterium]
MTMYVVATAGHVDHGKSALVRALTGMEPDRWAEEQRRGLTIDLGFAWCGLPGGQRVAFVDVPGHERFVPNMLAGVGPVPAVLFIVAADGGWMPQSAEHLAAIDAMGIKHGLLAVTRSDLADPGPATTEALDRIGGTSLGRVKAVAVSAVTGDGLPELRAALTRLVAALPVPGPADPVRLWVDRSFSIRGSGTVVTGTLPAGTVRMGQELLLSASMRPVSIRGIESLGEPVTEVSGVARVALNLRGVPADVPARGIALVDPARWTMTSTVDVRLPAGSDVRLPAELTLHIGSARTVARVRSLAAPSAPAPLAVTDAFARLTLRDALPLHVGDRVLLRDPGAATPLLIGATVLDVVPPPLTRRGAAAAAAAELGTWPEIPQVADLLRRHRLLRASALRAMGFEAFPAPVAGEWLADPAYWNQLQRQLAVETDAQARRDPLAPVLPAEAARAVLGLPDRVLADVLLRLLPPRAPVAPALPAAIAAAVTKVRADLASQPFAAPEANRLRELGLDNRAIAVAARAGQLLRITEQIVLAPGADKAAAEVLAGLPQPFTTAQAREALKTSRRVAIPLLEYLDRARVTERLPDDRRRIRPALQAAELGGAAEGVYDMARRAPADCRAEHGRAASPDTENGGTRHVRDGDVRVRERAVAHDDPSAGIALHRVTGAKPAAEYGGEFSWRHVLPWHLDLTHNVQITAGWPLVQSALMLSGSDGASADGLRAGSAGHARYGATLRLRPEEAVQRHAGSRVPVKPGRAVPGPAPSGRGRAAAYRGRGLAHGPGPPCLSRNRRGPGDAPGVGPAAGPAGQRRHRSRPAPHAVRHAGESGAARGSARVPEQPAGRTRSARQRHGRLCGHGRRRAARTAPAARRAPRHRHPPGQPGLDEIGHRRAFRSGLS